MAHRLDVGCITPPKRATRTASGNWIGTVVSNLLQGNKGGVTIRMSLYGYMICFVNCHLPAHMENVEQRLDDFEHILAMQQFESEKVPSILDHE